MGIFDKKEKKKADFSNVRSGSSTNSPVTSPKIETRPSNTYTVKKGDTLSAIALREYGDANEWRRIFESNRDLIEDPDLIHPGQQLTIPVRSQQEDMK